MIWQVRLSQLPNGSFVSCVVPAQLERPEVHTLVLGLAHSESHESHECLRSLAGEPFTSFLNRSWRRQRRDRARLGRSDDGTLGPFCWIFWPVSQGPRVPGS